MVRTASDIDNSEMQSFSGFHRKLLEKGVYLGPSGYEVGFVSASHSKQVLTESADKICEAISESV